MTWVSNPIPSILRVLVLLRPDLQQILVNEEHDLGTNPSPWILSRMANRMGQEIWRCYANAKFLTIYPLLPADWIFDLGTGWMWALSIWGLLGVAPSIRMATLAWKILTTFDGLCGQRLSKFFVLLLYAKIMISLYRGGRGDKKSKV